MNLKILDAKKDYVGLSERFPDNFYMNLAEKVVSRFTPQALKNGLDVTFRSKGNEVNYTIGPKGLTISVGGKKYTSSDKSLSSLEKIIYQIYQDDLKGDVVINHGNSSVVEDRTDFNKAANTVFTKLYKSVKFNQEGKKNQEVSGARSSALVLTEQQFKNASAVKSFKQINFKPITIDGHTYYVNKGVSVITADNSLNDQELSVGRVNKILSDIDGSLDLWAHSPALEKVLTNLESLTNTLFTYNGNAWLIKPGTTSYELIRL